MYIKNHSLMYNYTFDLNTSIAYNIISLASYYPTLSIETTLKIYNNYK